MARTRKHACLLAVVLALAVPAGTATAVPAGKQLAATNRIDARTTSSVDVVATRPFSSPTAIFDPRPGDLTVSRPGSGFALVFQDSRSDHPPVLVGANTPFLSSGRSFLFPFGTHPDGSEIFEHYRFPAGRYRLFVFTDGPTTIHLSLPGLPTSAQSVVKPTSRAVIPVQRLRAPDATATGQVLGAAAPAKLPERSILIQTVAARLPVSANGMQSHWCSYAKPPADGRYLPGCIGGSGTGVGRIGPIRDFEYVGFNSFFPIAGGTSQAFSRSVEAVGRVEGQQSLFIWLPYR